MVPNGGRESVTGNPGPPTPITFEGVGHQLSAMEQQIRSAARHSRNFSWFCWIFLFAGTFGYLLTAVIGILFPLTVMNGTQSSSTYPWWNIPVSFAPAVLFLALAVREVVRGRREARTGIVAPSRRARTGRTEEASLGWTETVQRCQQMVTHAKSEAEWSFVPLVLGLFGVAEFFFFVILEATLTILPPDEFLVAPVAALSVLAFLWPFYTAAKRWIGTYQTLLNRQVGELSRLEAEFLWRFAGAGSPT